jgi:hypothetical protein
MSLASSQEAKKPNSTRIDARSTTNVELDLAAAMHETFTGQREKPGINVQEAAEQVKCRRRPNTQPYLEYVLASQLQCC